MKITVARSYDLDGLYVDGILVKSASIIDIDDVIAVAGKESITLSMKFIDEDFVRLSVYILPKFEQNLVELDA